MIFTLLVSLFISSQPSFACKEHEAAELKPEAILASTTLVKGSIPDTQGAKSYGKGVTLADAPISLTEALKRRDEFAGKEIVVKAEVAQVCQSKGCWLMLKDGASQVRVTFHDYSFFVPKDVKKQEAIVQGKIFEKEISAAENRHYTKDEGKPASEVKKITEGAKSPWFEATGLTLRASDAKVSL